MTTSFTLGMDPELILVDKATQKLKSAIPIIDGTKRRPRKIPEGFVIHDNVNLEFGIEPADSEDAWVNRTGKVLKHIASIIPSTLEMKAVASSEFPSEELDHPEAKEFACDPDFNPYEFEINFIEDDAASGALRSCGGHVHIGSTFIGQDVMKQAESAKVMDIFLGVPSLLLDKDPTSHRRRKLYGKAGAHRPKSYGVEYRAMGNFWVSHPDLTRLIYLLVRDGMAAWENGHLQSIDWDSIRNTINNNDISKAENIVESLILPLCDTDARKLFAKCLKMKIPNLYRSWRI